MRCKHQFRKRRKKKPNFKPLSNYNIIELAVKMKIPHFHGVFMRDMLINKPGPLARECWILNHDSSHSNGTHWSALAKNFNIAFYFDSFGKLAPPLEVIDYLGNSVNLYYNVTKYQNFGSSICGHLCLKFLHDFWRKNI